VRHEGNLQGLAVRRYHEEVLSAAYGVECIEAIRTLTDRWLQKCTEERPHDIFPPCPDVDIHAGAIVRWSLVIDYPLERVTNGLPLTAKTLLATSLLSHAFPRQSSPFRSATVRHAYCFHRLSLI